MHPAGFLGRNFLQFKITEILQDVVAVKNFTLGPDVEQRPI